MSEEKKPTRIPESLASAQFNPQPETLYMGQSRKRITLGIPNDFSLEEKRTVLTNQAVRTLSNHGYNILVESGTGKGASISDLDFTEAGAEIVHSKERVFSADIILKIAALKEEELKFLRPDQVLISPLHIPKLSAKFLDTLKQKRVVALAMDYIKDRNGFFPIVRMMSEMAGIGAIHIASELLSTANNGKGVLLGGITGVEPSKVVIIGAGVVAEYATKAALGLGAEVRIFDNKIYKLKRLQTNLGIRVYTSTINAPSFQKEILDADVVIGAMHSKSGRSILVVSEEMVSKMKPGSVIVDVSIDQGGCFATSELRSIQNPSFVKHDVIHYCVPNISSIVSTTATEAMSNILTPILLEAAESGGMEQLIAQNISIRNGVYMYKGCLTNGYLGKRFKLKSTDINLFISSNY